jgi:hypothetical protein
MRVVNRIVGANGIVEIPLDVARGSRPVAGGVYSRVLPLHSCAGRTSR